MFNFIRPHADNYVEIVLGLVLVAYGVVLGWPGDVLPTPPSLILITGTIAETIFSAWAVVSGIVLFSGVCQIGTKWSRRARRIGSFGAFLAFLFLAFLSVAANLPLISISTLGLAVISGILHIRTGWERNE